MSVKKKDMSRREFLSKSIIGTTSASLFGVYGKAFLSSDQKEFSLGAKKGTIYRTLGKTGIRLPIVNMGIMNSFNSELIKGSYDTGVRHFDTAHFYQFGQSEEMLGNAIKELNVRDKVIISTKVAIPHHRQKMTLEQAN